MTGPIMILILNLCGADIDATLKVDCIAYISKGKRTSIARVTKRFKTFQKYSSIKKNYWACKHFMRVDFKSTDSCESINKEATTLLKINK